MHWKRDKIRGNLLSLRYVLTFLLRYNVYIILCPFKFIEEATQPFRFIYAFVSKTITLACPASPAAFRGTEKLFANTKFIFLPHIVFTVRRRLARFCSFFLISSARSKVRLCKAREASRARREEKPY